MPVRLKDIAKDLQLSVVTISKVLRDHPDISEETRERVLRRMKELNYRPNLAARALVTGRSYIIGLVVPDLVHPFFGLIAKALAGVLREKGYSLVLSSSEGDPGIERQEIDRLLARGVDAMIVASAQWQADGFQQIQEGDIPFILIDRHFSGLADHFVGVDDEQVGRLATNHLIEIGCRHLAHIGGPDVSTAIGRAAGFRQALQDAGVALTPEYIISREPGNGAADNTGYAEMKRLLRLNPRPDGVFCYNDPTAMGAMKAILDAGLAIPDDIAVVGCGNITYSDFLRVPLTTIDQQSESIGENAAALALSLLDKRRIALPRRVLLDPKLVVRASTQRTRAAGNKGE